MKKMNTKTTLSISEARKKIFDIAKDVQKPSTYYTLTENGRPKAVVMSAVEFDSLMENLEILGNPKIMASIKEAEKELKRGDYVTLDALMKEYGYTDSDLEPHIVREKPKKTYGVKRPKGRPKLKNDKRKK